MASDYDVQAAQFKKWLTWRLRQNKRDAITALALKIIVDTRLPRQGSLSLYRQYLKRGYTEAEQTTFGAAWQEMREG